MHSMNKGVHQKAECTLSVLRFLMDAFFLSSKEKLFSLFKREKTRRKRSFFIRPVWDGKKRFLIKAVKI